MLTRLLGLLLWCIAINCIVVPQVSAQCPAYQRVYANAEEANSNVAFINSDVSNPNNAVGSNLTDYSLINIAILGAIRYQRLKFPTTLNAGERIHVKLASTVDLSLLGITLSIQAYKQGAPVGSKLDISGGFLSLISGENISDFVIDNPGPSYDAVQVSVSATVAVGQIRVYAAYVDQPMATAGDCETSADLLTGTTSGLLGASNGVVNANNAIDNDMTTYATINQNIGIAGYVHITSLLPRPAVSGDLVSVTLKVPSVTVLSAAIFSKLSVVAYLGNNIVTSIPVNSAAINIRLLDAANYIYQFTYSINGAFDRISVQAGGLANAFTQVYVYDIRRLIPEPIASIDGSITSSKSFCETANPVLGISSAQACNTYTWYDAQSGGNLLYTGSNYAPGPLAPGTYHFYTEATRNNCTGSASQRTAITITVNPKAAMAAIQINSN